MKIAYLKRRRSDEISSAHRAIVIFSVAIAIVAILISTMQLYYMVMPATHWLEYYSVVPVSDIYVNERPVFLSTVEVFSDPVNLRYSDILFCKAIDDTDYFYKSEYESSSYGKMPKGRESNKWKYGHPVDEAGSCYLKTSVLLQLPFGVTRVQVITGPKFNVMEN